MLICCICLAWLLANTWATLILAAVYDIEIDGWRDVRDVILIAIISPWWLIILRYVLKLFKNRG